MMETISYSWVLLLLLFPEQGLGCLWSSGSGSGSSDTCSPHNSCDDCPVNDGCSWDGSACIQGTYQPTAGSACQKCDEWYNSAAESCNSWLTNLNIQIPCPCRARTSWGRLYPENGALDAAWDSDLACLRSGLPLCSTFHPGAYGCMRSANNIGGARQQCCYDDDLDLLPSDHEGAGTPDRSVDEHSSWDVDPYGWCCTDCNINSYCDKYKERRQPYSGC